VLTTAPAKKNTDSKFFHNLSVSTRRKFPVNLQCRSLFPEKLQQRLVEFRRLLELRHVAALIKHDQLGSAMPSRSFSPPTTGINSSAVPTHQRGHVDGGELRIFKLRRDQPAIMRWIV